MAKSIKLQDDNYIDSTGVVHNKKLLSLILTPKVLYENESNTATTITLNDSVTNYKRVLINAKGNDGETISTEIVNPNNKIINLIVYHSGGTSSGYYNTIKQSTYEITNNKITWQSGREVAINQNKVITFTNEAKNVYITNVIGYLF